jgi:hypothetical protein
VKLAFELEQPEYRTTLGAVKNFHSETLANGLLSPAKDSPHVSRQISCLESSHGALVQVSESARCTPQFDWIGKVFPEAGKINADSCDPESAGISLFGTP